MKATRTYTMGSRAEAVAATRDRIAREAAALFLEHPYEDVTLAAIAKAAGVSHQTVLNHFESKDGVVLGVAELMRAERLTVRHAEAGDVAGAVRALVGDYERMGDANFRWAASERLQVLAEILDERPPLATRSGSSPCSATGCPPRRPPASERCTPCTPPPTSTCGSCCVATWA